MVNFSKIKCKVEVKCNLGKQSMKANGKMIDIMAKAPILMKTIVDMKENGKTESNMEKENYWMMKIN
jgi:hypothetical protein